MTKQSIKPRRLSTSSPILRSPTPCSALRTRTSGCMSRRLPNTGPRCSSETCRKKRAGFSATHTPFLGTELTQKRSSPNSKRCGRPILAQHWIWPSYIRAWAIRTAQCPGYKKHAIRTCATWLGSARTHILLHCVTTGAFRNSCGKWALRNSRKNNARPKARSTPAHLSRDCKFLFDKQMTRSNAS